VILALQPRGKGTTRDGRRKVPDSSAVSSKNDPQHAPRKVHGFGFHGIFVARSMNERDLTRRSFVKRSLAAAMARA
jgi:hypothetical protein